MAKSKSSNITPRATSSRSNPSRSSRRSNPMIPKAGLTRSGRRSFSDGGKVK